MAENSSDTVIPITLATGTPGTPIPVGDAPIGVVITPDGRSVYVTDNRTTPGDDAVSVVDTATRTTVATVVIGSSPPLPDFYAPYGIAITPNGAKAYATMGDSTTVATIDTATRTHSGDITVPTDPVSVEITPDQAPTARLSVHHRRPPWTPRPPPSCSTPSPATTGYSATAPPRRPPSPP